MGVAEEGLGEGEDGVGADARRLVRAAGGEDADRAHAEVGQELQRLVLDHVRERAHEEKLARLRLGQDRDHGGEAGVLALREGRLDSGA
jgi:hypothetical protein